MKFFLASLSLSLLAATVQCVPSIHNTGSSAVSRSDDGHGNYAFGYNEDHATGGSFRKEKGGPGVQVGSYGLRDADGRMRVVSYVADAHGFRATISTNEPGVDPKQDPAAMDINGQGHATAPAPTYAAPAPAYAAAPAPITYAPGPIAHAPAPTYAAPVQTSSYQTSTTHIAPAPSAYAAPAPPAPLAYAAAPAPAASYAAPVLAKSYAAPAPVIQQAYAAPGPIAYAAEAAYQANAQHIAAAAAAASSPQYASAAPIISKAATYAAAAPVAAAAPPQIITKSYSLPSHALSAAAAYAPSIKAYPAPGGLGGLPATYSIHTLG